MTDTRLNLPPRSPDELESPDCNLCGSSKASTVYRVPPLKIVRCRRCRLVYTRPRLKPGVVEEGLYEEDFWSNYEQGYREGWPSIKFFAERWLDALAEESGRSSGRLLEIGAGLGGFMTVAASRGYEVYAVEPSNYAAERLRSLHGEDRVFQVPAEEVGSLDLPPMDFVVMMATIEHLHDPSDTLAQLNSLLADGGTLIVGTGVWGSPNQRLARKRWTIIAPQGHLYYFSKKTLRKLLEKGGFEVQRLETNQALINELTDSPLLVKLFNNRHTARWGLAEWIEKHRLGDEMWMIARKVRTP